MGLEQVVWDEEDQNGSFKKQFQEAENYLKTLLCEIQLAIIEHNLETKPDPTRDIMGEELRSMDKTSTNIRNWVIYRDYMIMMEYVIEVFDHFKTKLG